MAELLRGQVRAACVTRAGGQFTDEAARVTARDLLGPERVLRLRCDGGPPDTRRAARRRWGRKPRAPPGLGRGGLVRAALCPGPRANRPTPLWSLASLPALPLAVPTTPSRRPSAATIEAICVKLCVKCEKGHSHISSRVPQRQP